MSPISKNVMITGVSSGIGLGIAKELVARKFRVFGTVRDASTGDRVRQEVNGIFIPLIMDVTRDEDVKKAALEVGRMVGNEGLSVLINNAGIAIAGPLQHQSMQEIKDHFEVNVFGLIRVTQAFLPLLGAKPNSSHPPGRIINISSAGGKIAAPFVGAYIATKHAVEGLSSSLRRELLIYGIDVIVVGPGAVKTPIWNKGMKAGKYEDTEYAPYLKHFTKGAMKGAEAGLTTEYLGKKIVDIVESRFTKARYAFVPQPLSNWFIPRILPARVLDSIIRRKLFRK